VFESFIGAAAALVFCTIGSAYGTAKSGVGVAAIGVNNPQLIMKSSVPVIMAGMVGIYGLIIAVFVGTNGRYFETNSIRFVLFPTKSRILVE